MDFGLFMAKCFWFGGIYIGEFGLIGWLFIHCVELKPLTKIAILVMSILLCVFLTINANFILKLFILGD